mgnify:CR=1 FL=1|tara:strand:+ start:3724 stop:4536 length:813 start_codon:yes stop_codon:yes gene_type:complete
MKIIRRIKDLSSLISNVGNLGFVPTMGGIHSGHLSLISKSMRKCNKTLVSIYVNPTQFNNKNDFKVYPRNLKRDLNILKKKKIHFVFIPKTTEIYKNKRLKKIKLPKQKNILCGKFRKNHFEGVIDIIDRFLKIINPDYMFLGEKDFQQLFLIRNFFKKKYKVKIISCKTIRNNNFVAQSSRNFLLSKKNMVDAGKIIKKIKLFKSKIKSRRDYKVNINRFKLFLTKKYKIKIEYLELRNEKNLGMVKKGNKFRLFVAYYINKIRLIDNF